MEIILLRHGKPNFEYSRKISANELGHLVKLYNAAGTKSIPPEQTKRRVRECKITVCSNLPRSLESAKALGITDIHFSAPLFSEVGLPYANWSGIKLSLENWAILFRVMWLFGYSTNGETIRNTKQRAEIASSFLIKQAKQHQSVLLIGHGFINRFIASELLKQGWSGSSSPGKNFWEFGVYNK